MLSEGRDCGVWDMVGEAGRTRWWDRYLVITPLVGMLVVSYTWAAVRLLLPLSRTGALWQPGPERGALFSLALTLLFIFMVPAVGAFRWRLQHGLRYFDCVLAGVMMLAFGRMTDNVWLFMNADLLPSDLYRAVASETGSMASLLGTILLACGVPALVISLTRAREENMVLKALGDVARSLSHLDLQETLSRTLVRLAELTGADTCTIYLVERDGALLPVSTHQQGHLGPEELARLTSGRLQPRQGLVGWSVARSEPVLCADAARDPRNDLCTLPGERISMLVVPLLGDGRALGAIRLTRQGVNRFSSAHMDLVSIFAGQAAVVIENGRLFGEVRQLSITDSSTGLFNSRHFGECLERELRTAGVTQRPLSLVMIDSDSLKQVNDRLGHPAGDMLIRTVGDTIRSCIRAGDLVFRYAGDEFMALLPGADLAAAHEVAERMRTAVQHRVMHYQNVSFRGTVSVGVATFPDHGGGGDELIKAADNALYVSKFNGKNRVTLATSA